MTRVDWEAIEKIASGKFYMEYWDEGQGFDQKFVENLCKQLLEMRKMFLGDE